MDLSAELKALEEAQKNEETSAAQRQDHEKRIREAIAQGGTTGDAICDFVIAKHGSAEIKSMVPILRGLEERMRGKSGQYVAAIETTIIVTVGDPGIVCPVDRRSYHRLLIGVLGDTSLVFSDKRDQWGLPMSQYIDSSQGFDKAIAKSLFFKEKFQNVFAFGHDIYQGLPSFGRLKSEELGITILVGDSELLQWLTDLTVDLVLDRHRPKEWWINLFSRMALHLDRDLKEMPLFARTILSKQERLIRELTELDEQRARLKGAQETLMTGSDLELTIQSIQTKLAAAVGYGLAGHPLIVKLEEEYGVPQR